MPDTETIEEAVRPPVQRPAMPKATVVIGTPSGGMVYDEFNETIFRMQTAALHNRIRLIPARCSGSHLPHNQNNIVKAARDVNKRLVDAGEPGVDAIFFYETDEGIREPEGVIERLLSHGKDIVGATYCFKKPDKLEVMGVELDGKPIDWTSLYHREEVTEVAGLPIGALLIRMHVFDVIENEFIPEWAKEYGRLPSFYQDISATSEGPIPRTSDYTFCTRARTCGFKIWLDAPLSRQIDHYGTYPYRLPDPAQMSADIAMMHEIHRSYAEAAGKEGAPEHFPIWAERLQVITAQMARGAGVFAKLEAA